MIELKNFVADFYSSFTIYYDNGEEETFSEHSYETISVEENDGINHLHVGDYTQGLWNFYEDGTCDHWFYQCRTIDDRKAIGFEVN